MTTPANSQKKIADTEDLIARAEERVRTLQAKAEPGTARIVHTLTNNIRKYRRDLQKLLAGQPTMQKHQLRQQHRQMQQARRETPAGRSDELPERQDQEPRKPAPKQGTTAGQ